MAREMLLMDQVHALTFAKKLGGFKVDAAVADVQRTFRAKLRAAERFVLDDDAVRLVTRLSYEHYERFEGWSYLSRLPHDPMWIEYNATVQGQEIRAIEGREFKPVSAKSRTGFLIHCDATDPLCPRWVACCFATTEAGDAVSEPFSIVFDPEGDDKFPVRGSQFWRKPTLSLRPPGFPRAVMSTPILETDGGVGPPAFFECDPELALSGLFYRHKIDLGDVPTLGEDGLYHAGGPVLGPDWLTPRLAMIADPLWDAMFAGRPSELDKIIIGRVGKNDDGPCWLIAMLAAINGLPRDVRFHAARKGRHSVGMYTMPYFGSSTVSIVLPQENRLIRAREILDKSAKTERHLRRHKVRGHWRVVQKGVKVTYLCRHLPIMVENGLAMCERCEMLVRWIEAHERGDSTLGVVAHDYEVTA